MSIVQIGGGGLTKAAADALYQVLDADLTAIAALAPADGTFIRRTSGVWNAAAIVSADLTTALTTPPAIGGTTPAAGAFTTARADPGSAGTPGVSFNGDTNTGMSAATADTLVLSTAGVARLTINSAGLVSSASGQFTSGLRIGATSPAELSEGLRVRRDVILSESSGNKTLIGTGTAVTKLHIIEADAVTATVTNVLTVGHNSSGTPAASFGAGLAFQLESSTTENQDAGLIAVDWSTATHASRASRMTLSVYNVATKTAVLTLTPALADVTGTIQADGLRLDVTPTAETPSMTHTITISVNGTNYKIPCVAA